MRTRFGIQLILVIVSSSCIYNTATTPDAGQADASVADANQPDAVVCPVPAAGEPGSTCAEDVECDSSPGAGDGICISSRQSGPFRWPGEGYCLHLCTQASDCAEGTFCAYLEPEPGPATAKVCMPSCCEGVAVGDACSPGRICSDRLYGYIPLGGNACLPGNNEATDGDSCMGFYECNLYSQCRRDAFEWVGGSCRTVECTVGDDATCAPGGDGHCVHPDDEFWALCLDACENDSDCRMAEGYQCVDGTAEGLGKYCAHPTVGQECTTPGDCGDAAWSCLTGTTFPGGYCSIEGCTVGSLTSCSLSSTCYDPDTGNPGDEYCVAQCDSTNPDSCRPGYMCVDAGRDSSGNPIKGCVPMQ